MIYDMTKAITTIYPTKDWVISDFPVTKFGGRAEAGFDNREAFQSAIDAAYAEGGGVVYVPAGNYEFRSTKSAVIGVRVRNQDGGETLKEFSYEYVLTLPPGVQLRGDWVGAENVNGSVLEVRVGADSPNYDGKIESWWNDSQADNALRSAYTSVADRFIEMNRSTGVTNLSIWYPDQDITNVRKYPWTLFQTSGDSATVENVTLVNAYNGFYSAPSELHHVLNSYITALNTGIELHVCTDIGRIENVSIDPKYWADSGLPGAPSLEAVSDYTRAKGTGFQMHRSDWEYVSGLRVADYHIGMWVGREPGFSDAPNAQFYEIDIKNCETGVYIEDVNPYGLLFSNSAIGGDTAVYFHTDFSTSVQFNGIAFTGSVTSDGKGGVISFENCGFDGYSDYALWINSGNVLLTQNHFKKYGGSIYLGENVDTFKALNNGELTVKDDSTKANVEIRGGGEYPIEPIPKNIKTDIAVHPKPQSNNVLKVDLPKASGYNNDSPTKDVSAELQVALDAAYAAGGGTVYLPAGRYLVNNPIVIPSGVELRGTWDVQHHTQGGGAAVFTNYTGGPAGEKGPSLIQLKPDSGIRGISLVQANLVEEGDGYGIVNPRRTPFLIQGQGRNVYIINVTVPLADKCVDLYSYDTSGHYVEYIAGAPTRAGIWAGGGARGGYIRNMQFNPHYASRLPDGGQGYPCPGGGGREFMQFIQGNCGALKFADVTGETIFNNFVYGSVYGIHFLKDAKTGKYPGEIIVVGHGSDGCTFALYMEEAGPDTKITAINSELVNTLIKTQAVRAYVKVGDEANTEKVHHDARLLLYNSAFWGSPTTGAIINNGVVRFHQANFSRTGEPCIDVRGGSAHVYSSFFAAHLPDKEDDSTYARLRDNRASIEFSNNYYSVKLDIRTSNEGQFYGSDKV
jgi:hypothetical protein